MTALANLQHEASGARALFPIMAVDYDYREKIGKSRDAGLCELVIALPWDMIAPHEKQALANHGQTLKRLAERGGLSACEAVAILSDNQWQRMPFEQAHQKLHALLLVYARDGLAPQGEQP